MRKRGEQAASTRVLSLDAIWAPKLLEKWPSSAHTDPAGPGIVLASGLRSAADVSGSPEQSGPVGETRQHGAQPRPRGTVRTATRLGSYKRHRLVAAGSLDSQAKRHSGYTSTESEALRCFDNETGNSFEKSAPSESHCGVSCSGTTENDTCRSESLLRHIPEDTNNERCSIIEKAGSGMIVQPARKQPMCGHSGRISRHQCADDNRNGIGRNEYLKSAAQTLPSTPFSSANDSLDAGNVKSALNTNAASLCASCSGSLLFRQYAVSDGYASSAESLSLSSEEHTRDAGDVQVPEHTQCRDKHRTRQAVDEPAETSCLQHNLSSSMAETTNEHELSWADPYPRLDHGTSERRVSSTIRELGNPRVHCQSPVEDVESPGALPHRDGKLLDSSWGRSGLATCTRTDAFREQCIELQRRVESPMQPDLATASDRHVSRVALSGTDMRCKTKHAPASSEVWSADVPHWTAATPTAICEPRIQRDKRHSDERVSPVSIRSQGQHTSTKATDVSIAFRARRAGLASSLRILVARSAHADARIVPAALRRCVPITADRARRFDPCARLEDRCDSGGVEVVTATACPLCVLNIAAQQMCDTPRDQHMLAMGALHVTLRRLGCMALGRSPLGLLGWCDVCALDEPVHSKRASSSRVSTQCPAYRHAHRLKRVLTLPGAFVHQLLETAAAAVTTQNPAAEPALTQTRSTLEPFWHLLKRNLRAAAWNDEQLLAFIDDVLVIYTCQAAMAPHWRTQLAEVIGIAADRVSTDAAIACWCRCVRDDVPHCRLCGHDHLTRCWLPALVALIWVIPPRGRSRWLQKCLCARLLESWVSRRTELQVEAQESAVARIDDGASEADAGHASVMLLARVAGALCLPRYEAGRTSGRASDASDLEWMVDAMHLLLLDWNVVPDIAAAIHSMRRHVLQQLRTVLAAWTQVARTVPELRGYRLRTQLHLLRRQLCDEPVDVFGSGTVP